MIQAVCKGVLSSECWNQVHVCDVLNFHRRTGNAGFSHYPHTAQKLPYRRVPHLKSSCWWHLSQSRTHHLAFLSPIWRTADTRRPIVLQYFSPFLNLNDWLRYSLFQGNPCWISHYSVCLRCLYNGNFGFGTLHIWASTRAVCSVGRCRTKRDWSLRV